MSLHERLLVKFAAYMLPQKIAFKLARGFLASQGIGWGGNIYISGESKFIKYQISQSNDPCVFDVVANEGDWSMAALDANDSIQLHLFEPSSIHFQILKSRFPRQRIAINPYGLSDVNGNYKLYKDSDISGLASCLPRDLNHLGIRLNKIETVRLETGDDYIVRHNIRRVDLLKIDVEGWEMSVLNGFHNAFSKQIIRCCQFVFGHAHIERRVNFRDFYRFFVDRGFVIGPLCPN